jgi:hypothetical protein
MNRSESSTRRSERERMMVDFLAHIIGLFSRLPSLIGFSVQDRRTLSPKRDAAQLDAALCIADVTIDAWPGMPAEALGDEIVAALQEFLTEHPAARGLLRGYTFARAFH